MPNQMMNSGTSAIFGIGNNADTTAIPGERASVNSPTATPSASPAPCRPPSRSRGVASDALECAQSSPLIARLYSALAISTGADRNFVEIQPTDAPSLPERHDADERRTRRHGHIARRETARAKRNAAGEASGMSRFRRLARPPRRSRIIAHKRASMATGPRPSARRSRIGRVDPHDLAHPPGTARQHDDAVARAAPPRRGCASRTPRSRRCRAISAENSSSSRSRVCASSADSGSSISSTAGRTASARAMPTRWRIPPESCFGHMPGELAETGERRAPRSTRARRSARDSRASSSTSEMLPATVRHGSSAKSWNT